MFDVIQIVNCVMRNHSLPSKSIWTNAPSHGEWKASVTTDGSLAWNDCAEEMPDQLTESQGHKHLIIDSHSASANLTERSIGRSWGYSDEQPEVRRVGARGRESRARRSSLIAAQQTRWAGLENADIRKIPARSLHR
jgi:hypothetical protein